jgi:hypothetical protein
MRRPFIAIAIGTVSSTSSARRQTVRSDAHAKTAPMAASETSERSRCTPRHLGVADGVSRLPSRNTGTDASVSADSAMREATNCSGSVTLLTSSDGSGSPSAGNTSGAAISRAARAGEEPHDAAQDGD